MNKAELIDGIIRSIASQEGINLSVGYYERYYKDYATNYNMRELRILHRYYRRL